MQNLALVLALLAVGLAPAKGSNASIRNPVGLAAGGLQDPSNAAEVAAKKVLNRLNKDSDDLVFPRGCSPGSSGCTEVGTCPPDSEDWCDPVTGCNKNYILREQEAHNDGKLEYPGQTRPRGGGGSGWFSRSVDGPGFDICADFCEPQHVKEDDQHAFGLLVGNLPDEWNYAMAPTCLCLDCADRNLVLKQRIFLVAIPSLIILVILICCCYGCRGAILRRGDGSRRRKAPMSGTYPMTAGRRKTAAQAQVQAQAQAVGIAQI
jgi:hypothetical protein